MKNQTLKASFIVAAMLLISTVFAQNPLQQRLHLKGIAAPHLAAKTNAHEDYPQSYLYFDWNDTQSQWDSLQQHTLTYNINGWVTEEITANYSGGGFSPYYKDNYVYDASGNVTLSTHQRWISNAWTDYTKFIQELDPFGNTTVDYSLLWNGTTWDTVIGSRYFYTYRNTNQIATQDQEDFIHNGQWLPFSRLQFGYNANDEWDTITHFDWQQGWEAESRSLDILWHDFQAEKPLRALSQVFYNNTWNDVERFVVAYSPLNETWLVESFSNTWDSSAKLINTYDIHEHEIVYDYFLYIGGWVLDNSERKHYTYDLNGHTLEMWSERFDNTNSVYNKIAKYVYSNFFVGASEPHLATLNATPYPNPCTDQLNFDLQLEKPSPVTITLYDLQGRLRVQTQAPALQGRVTMPISESLEGGTYIYHITTAHGQATGKVIFAR